jgi:hypothetical protein
VLGVGGAQVQDHASFVDLDDLKSVGEPQPARKPARVHHDPVEQVRFGIGEYVLNLSELVPVPREDGNAGFDRQV